MSMPTECMGLVVVAGGSTGWEALLLGRADVHTSQPVTLSWMAAFIPGQ